MKKKVRLMIVIICIVVFALSACSPKVDGSLEETSTGAKEPVSQDEKMIFAASRDQAPGKDDAYYVNMNLGIWEPLITKDDQGNPLPALAESWESNDEKTIWTFKLAEDKNFSNGVKFNADMVVANFDRYKKGPFDSSYYGFNIDTVYPGLISVEALDEYRVELAFEEPVPMLTYMMVNFGSSIFEPSSFDEEGSFIDFPIGTGPYIMKENKIGEYCIIERNENYNGQAAYLKNIEFRVIPDANTRYSALLAGEVDGLADLGAITPSLAAELENNPDFEISVGDSGITHFINVNGNRPPFNDLKMREGFSLILDRDLINQEFFNGYNKIAGGFLNYTSAFYKEIPAIHDGQKGMEMINQAMGGIDRTLEILVPTVDANRYPYEELAEYIQSLLLGAGVDSNITLLEWATARDMMKDGDYDICLKIQGLPSADPYGLFFGFMHTDGATNANYGLGYSNTEVDKLIDNAKDEISIERKREIYNSLQEISARDFPNIPLLYAQEVVAYSSKVGGYKATSYGLEGYTKVKWLD